MFGVDLKRIASASGLSSVFGLGGPSASEKPSASERPRNSDGAGPSAGGREQEEEEGASHEKTATTNLISAGHESFELIFMMLMGIRTSVGRFCAQAQARELASSDFEQQWEGDFLGKGSAETPAHGHYDFRFKDYAPLVFRQIRERFGIEAPDYMLSLTSEYVLVEMFTNSKSGSFFFYSSDFRFILKTCTKREAAFLMAALPQYHAHLMQNRYTLLSRIFGLHRVQMRSGRRVFFVVMGNVFPIDRPVHERYDLKGSTRNRFTTDEERQDPNVVLKDLDWINSGRKLHLGGDKKRRLLGQIKKDCALLEKLEVIDYSMLVGIHRTSAKGAPPASEQRHTSSYIKVGSSARGGGGGAGGSADDGAAGSTDGASSEAGGSSVAGAMGEAAAQREAAVRILDTVSQQELHEEQMKRTPAPRGRGALEESGSEIYFVGLIDILCEYGLKKQLEHHYKAAKHGERVGNQNFSVVDPVQYSERFQKFVADALV